MNYEDIKCVELRQAAQNALKELEYYSFKEIKSSLNSSDVLPNEIKKNVNTALNEIVDSKSIDGNIGLLKYNLNKLIDLMNCIEGCQKMKDSIANFKRDMDDESSSDKRELKRQRKNLSVVEEKISKILEKKRSSSFFDF